jgi:hypothetical protein
MSTIILYIGNELSNKEEVSHEEVYKGLKEFEHFKNNHLHTSFDACLRVYVSSKDGLNATYNESSFTGLYIYCNEQFKNEKLQEPKIICFEIGKSDVFLEYDNNHSEYVSFTKAKKLIYNTKPKMLKYACADHEKSLEVLNYILSWYSHKNNTLILKTKDIK